MNISLSSVSSPEVIQLFSEYDDFIIDFLGNDSMYYTRYSENENINYVWLAYFDDAPIACAAYRVKSPGVGEVKRVFVKEAYRGRGVSKLLLAKIEEHAKRRGDSLLHLSTRVTLEPAVTLYRRFGYNETLRGGLYVEMEKKLL